MNTALDYSVIQQRHLELVRDSRRHALASVPPRERRPPQRRHSVLLTVLRPLVGH